MITLPRRILRAVPAGTVRFYRSHGMVYSAAVAFNLLLSAIPILFLVFAALSLVFQKSDLPFAQLADFLRRTFPYGGRTLVPILKELMSSRAVFGILGFLLLLLSSFSATDAVHTSLGVMLGKKERARFSRSAVFHVSFIFGLTLLTFASVLVPHLWRGIAVLTAEMIPPFDVAFGLLLQAVADIALVAIIFAGGAVSYRYLSPVPIPWPHALGGGLGFLALLYVVKWGFFFYVKRISRLNVIYGSLVGVICFIIAAYLFAAAYLLCASVIGVMLGEEPEGGLPSPAGEDPLPGG